MKTRHNMCCYVWFMPHCCTTVAHLQNLHLLVPSRVLYLFIYYLPNDSVAAARETVCGRVHDKKLASET